jgi:hypothetical protein
MAPLPSATKSAVKMLVLGNSGTGKTGALVSLAEAGYNIFILDYDNGLSAVRNFTTAAVAARFDVETLTDQTKLVGKAFANVGMPQAFSKGMSLLSSWNGRDLSKASPDDTIVVIDSLTFLSSAAFRYILAINSRSQAQIQDWGQAMALIEGVLGLLYSDSFSPNVIITGHLTYVEGENGASVAYPSSLGQKLSPKIGRFFDTVVQTKSVGSGTMMKRVIRTVSDGLVEAKVPVACEIEYLQATGLATLFQLLRKRVPASKAPLTVVPSS